MLAVKYCAGCTIKDLVFEMNNIGEDAVGFDRCSDTTAQNLTISNVAYPANAALVAAGNTRNKYSGTGFRIRPPVHGRNSGHVDRERRRHPDGVEPHDRNNTSATSLPPASPRT